MAVDPDSIPRYAPPAPGELDGPARTCGGCAHADDLEGAVVCCCERDKVGTLGMLYVVAADDEACDDWEEDQWSR